MEAFVWIGCYIVAACVSYLLLMVYEPAYEWEEFSAARLLCAVLWPMLLIIIVVVAAVARLHRASIFIIKRGHGVAKKKLYKIEIHADEINSFTMELSKAEYELLKRVEAEADKCIWDYAGQISVTEVERAN